MISQRIGSVGRCRPVRQLCRFVGWSALGRYRHFGCAVQDCEHAAIEFWSRTFSRLSTALILAYVAAKWYRHLAAEVIAFVKLHAHVCWDVKWTSNRIAPLQSQSRRYLWHRASIVSFKLYGATYNSLTGTERRSLGRSKARTMSKTSGSLLDTAEADRAVAPPEVAQKTDVASTIARVAANCSRTQHRAARSRDGLTQYKGSCLHDQNGPADHHKHLLNSGIQLQSHCSYKALNPPRKTFPRNRDTLCNHALHQHLRLRPRRSPGLGYRGPWLPPAPLAAAVGMSAVQWEQPRCPLALRANPSGP